VRRGSPLWILFSGRAGVTKKVQAAMLAALQKDHPQSEQGQDQERQGGQDPQPAR
jgi:hypothetical protein